MPTLAQLTKAHSERLSELARTRDQRLLSAAADRDRQLRALPSTAKAFRAFDDELVTIATRDGADQAKADAARTLALENAHRMRRDADLAAFERRKLAETMAERKFVTALATMPSRGSVDAQRARADELEKARREFDDAIEAAQQKFRDAVGAALVSARKESSAAVANAERELAQALDAIPATAAVTAAWRNATAAIVADYREAEDGEFERFRRELAIVRR